MLGGIDTMYNITSKIVINFCKKVLEVLLKYCYMKTWKCRVVGKTELHLVTHSVMSVYVMCNMKSCGEVCGCRKHSRTIHIKLFKSGWGCKLWETFFGPVFTLLFYFIFIKTCINFVRNFFYILIFFKFYFIFKLYSIVLVLPYIEMNPPQVYMCSPSWTLLPPLFETFLTISVLQEASLLSALRNLDHPSFVIHYQLHSFSCG